MAFSNENGLYGIARMGIAPAAVAGCADALNADNSATLLATGGSVTLSHDPMFSTGVYGAGWYDAAAQVAYAFNDVRLEGSVDFELVTGHTITALQSFGFDQRGHVNGHTFEVRPNGQGGFHGNAWCSGMSLTASEGAVVTGSVSYSSDQTAKFHAIAGANQTTRVGSIDFGGTLFPYWGTKVQHGGATLATIVDWSADYTSTVNYVTLCRGASHLFTPPAGPDFILIGTMDATGSFTVFGMPDLVSATAMQDANDVVYTCYNQDGVSSIEVKLTSCIFTSSGPSIAGGGDYVSVAISFTAVGDGNSPPMKLTQLTESSSTSTSTSSSSTSTNSSSTSSSSTSTSSSSSSSGICL